MIARVSGRLLRWLVVFAWTFPGFAVVDVFAQTSPSTGATDEAISPGAGWPTYGGDPGGRRYSPLESIDPENVENLEVAWVFETGERDPSAVVSDARGEIPLKTAFQTTPVLLEDTLYLCTPLSQLIALDAERGDERWRFDAEPQIAGDMTKTCRGVAVWREESAREHGPADFRIGVADGTRARRRVVSRVVSAGDDAHCRSRVFMGTVDAGLFAVDAETGRLCLDFGSDGRVDLLEGMGDVAPGEMYMTSPPTIVGDLVITGAMVRDNQRVASPGGVVRGFDVRTGELRWAFDPVPPGTPGRTATPGPSDLQGPAADVPHFHRGTPNAWSILSADLERNLVFVPFGNASPDFFGGERKGFDYYSSSVVALDASTGKPVWRFQTVHHDLWDYDVASQPVLFDHEIDGEIIPALAQATKMGHLFILNRETGRPLYPVEERPVPQTDVPGEWTSPTQPFPTFPAPLHTDQLSPDDAFGFTPFDRAACRRKIGSLRNEGIFTPPSLLGSIQFPGVAGGSNWGSIAYDPKRRLVVLNQNSMAQVHTLVPRDTPAEDVGKARHMGLSEMAGTPYRIHQEVLLSPLGVPCVPTPWGSLMAVSLSTGEKVWEIPFGTTRDLVPFFPVGFDFGLPSMGGPIVTASGVAFIGASMDRYIRAYDVETGRLLWKDRLPAGGQATPMTYRVGPSGRQFVVIAAGGHGTLGTRSGDSVVAYALPLAPNE